MAVEKAPAINLSRRVSWAACWASPAPIRLWALRTAAATAPTASPTDGGKKGNLPGQTPSNGARDYDPTTGRWRRKIPFFSRPPSSIFTNDPVNLFDPSGLTLTAAQRQVLINNWIALGTFVGGTLGFLGGGGGGLITGPGAVATAALGTGAGRAVGAAAGAAVGAALANFLDGEEKSSGCDESDSRQLRKLSRRDIKKLKDAGYNLERLKTPGGNRAGKLDSFKDRAGNLYVRPKYSSGPAEPLGLNLNNLPPAY